MKKYDRNKNNGIYSALDEILGTISGIARTASEELGIKESYNSAVNLPADPQKEANAVADSKVKLYQIILKYVGSAILFYFSLVSLASALFIGSLAFSIVVACISAVLWGGAVGLLISANKNRKLRKLIKEYLPAIGLRPEASLSYLTYALKKEAKTVKKEISLLLHNGVFPNEAYYDKSMEILVLDGYCGESNNEEEKYVTKLEEWIVKLEKLDLEIDCSDVSFSLASMVVAIKKISEYIKIHPETEKKLRMLYNYYLPTTVKLCESYKTIEKLDLSGDNVNETRTKIVETLRSLVKVYEKQLESLYEGEAIDISSDVDVLKRMMDNEKM